MGIKKITAAAVTAACLACAMVMPVMAETGIDTFFVQINGGAVVSSFSYRKDTVGAMSYSVKENPKSNITWVQGREIVNLRGRTKSGAKCTDLSVHSTRGSGTMSYTGSYGKFGEYYKLAAQYDSSNPYTKLDLICTWTP